MIGEQFQELAHTVKEMLSSEGGYYEESMAPLIGGNRPHRGRLEPLDRMMILRTKEYDAGTFHGRMEDVYHVFPLVINNDRSDEGEVDKNYIYIYKEEGLPIEFAYRIFESWAHEFYEKTIEEL